MSTSASVSTSASSTTKPRPEQRKERRRRKKFVTRNSEYHFDGERCVAIRDRRQGTWQLAHGALAKRLGGTIRFDKAGCAFPTFDPPEAGDALFFGNDAGPELITSIIDLVARPTKDEVEAYPL